MPRLLPVLIVLACLLPGAAVAPAERPPNVIVIFADDLGYGDLGVYGHPTIRTPHLDRMAADGMRFTQFYSAAPVCTPSRAGLLTGRLPVRSGMTSDRRRVLFPNSALGLPHEEVTIAEGLKDQGYATAMVGKWHLGHLPDYLPPRHGFDAYFGIPYSNDMSPNQNPNPGAAAYPPTPLIRGIEQIEAEPDQREITRRYTEEAVGFIRRHRSDPFFLYIAHTFPHIPLYASDTFEGTSARGLYGDVIEELDWSVGQVLTALRELDIDERTLVVFTSDNGPWLTEALEGGSAGLLKDGKGTTWEGGVRVPAIAWWPGTIRGGQTTQALASTLDLLPTAFALAGAPLPTDRVIDGRNLTPLLTGDSDVHQETIYYYRGSRLWALRHGPWKMHFRTQSAYVGDQPVEHDPPALYHLDHDPSERFDVAGEHPDVIRTLTEIANAHRATLEPVDSRLEVMIEE